MPTLNLSDGKTISGYVRATNAQLQIMSVPTQFLLKFPAFLTDFSQTFDAKWNTEEVFGRMDPIATYQGTKRTMSLGFDLPAGSIEEAKKNLKGCSELVKMVYPVYNNQDILAKPPLARIQFANLIKGDSAKQSTVSTSDQDVTQDPLSLDNLNAMGDTILADAQQNANKTQKFFGLLGWISGLSWKPNLEMGMFTTGEKLYPKVISLSFSFNVLHEKTPSQKSTGMFPFGG
jgi:hypothetical protein